MTKQAFFLVAALISFPAYALENDALPSTSLFFTTQEIFEASVQAHRVSFQKPDEIRLGAVFYYAPGDWTLWLQGEKWTPDTSRGNLRVLDVTADSVRIAVKGPDGTETDIALKPNQAYDIKTGNISGSP